MSVYKYSTSTFNIILKNIDSRPPEQTKFSKHILKMASRTSLLLGQCLPCLKQNASKIRVRRMELDKNINMVCNFVINLEWD